MGKRALEEFDIPSFQVLKLSSALDRENRILGGCVCGVSSYTAEFLLLLSSQSKFDQVRRLRVRRTASKVITPHQADFYLTICNCSRHLACQRLKSKIITPGKPQPKLIERLHQMMEQWRRLPVNRGFPISSSFWVARERYLIMGTSKKWKIFNWIYSLWTHLPKLQSMR